MSSVAADHVITSPGHDHAHEKPHGWRRWLFATNHKDIGTMYLIFSFCMLLEGGVLALLIRTELFEPGLQFFQPELFNQFTSMHGRSEEHTSELQSLMRISFALFCLKK